MYLLVLILLRKHLLYFPLLFPAVGEIGPLSQWNLCHGLKKPRAHQRTLFHSISLTGTFHEHLNALSIFCGLFYNVCSSPDFIFRVGSFLGGDRCLQDHSHCYESAQGGISGRKKNCIEFQSQRLQFFFFKLIPTFLLEHTALGQSPSVLRASALSQEMIPFPGIQDYLCKWAFWHL